MVVSQCVGVMVGCSHEINSHEINSHEINSHEINSHQINFSRDQFPYDQLNFFYLIITINTNKLCNSNTAKMCCLPCPL